MMRYLLILGILIGTNYASNSQTQAPIDTLCFPASIIQYRLIQARQAEVLKVYVDTLNKEISLLNKLASEQDKQISTLKAKDSANNQIISMYEANKQDYERIVKLSEQTIRSMEKMMAWQKVERVAIVGTAVYVIVKLITKK